MWGWGEEAVFSRFSGGLGIVSQLISEEDGWEEEGENKGGNGGGSRKN